MSADAYLHQSVEVAQMDLKDRVRQAAASYNRHDLDGYLADYADDAELVGPIGTFRGLRAIREHNADELAAFADLKVTVDRVLVEDNVAVVEYHFSGTHTGPLRSRTGETIKATNKGVVGTSVDVITYRDGKVTSVHSYLDTFPIFLQLGLMPQPSGAGS